MKKFTKDEQVYYYQRYLELRDIAGMTSQAIADRLGLNRNTLLHMVRRVSARIADIDPKIKLGEEALHRAKMNSARVSNNIDKELRENAVALLKCIEELIK